MFERYTEHARRAIFFARYEASQLGSPNIETEHVLLGLLREDHTLRNALPGEQCDRIRRRIEQRVPQGVPPWTTVTLPLSDESKRGLALAAEESEALRHSSIDSWHLALGLLRLENSVAAGLLREAGVEYAAMRAAPPESLLSEADLTKAPAGPLPDCVSRLQHVLNAGAGMPESGPMRLKRAAWTRKEALGHLIDWAAAHQQWLARALTSPELTAVEYPPDSWLAAQNYQEMLWSEARTLWLSLNGLLLHVIQAIPAEKVETPCRIGAAPPIPLRELVERYIAHCDDIVGQLLMRG